MKFVNLFKQEAFSQGGNGKLPSFTAMPATEASRTRPMLVLLAPELGGMPESGAIVGCGMVGKEKTQPMLFPPKPKDHADNRILLLAEFKKPAHREEGRIDPEKTTAKILLNGSGGGAWGSGCVFLALLEEGQRVVSRDVGGRRVMYQLQGGKVSTFGISSDELEMQDGEAPEML